MSSSRERRSYMHSPLHGGIELLAAEYRHHVFPRHVQDQVVIGVVERGHIHFVGGAIDAEIGEGDILYIAPGTPHEALGEGHGAWTYRALYLSPEQWAAACSLLGSPVPAGAAVLRDPGLYDRMRRFHRRLVSGSASERGLELALRQLVDAVATHQGDASARTAAAAVEPVARVREVLDSTPTRRMTLEEMSALSGMSRYHFLRAFARAYGVSPYAYCINRRLQEAQRRLASGRPIATTALDVGFADQAHLTRHFLKTIGVTPGEYQRAFA